MNASGYVSSRNETLWTFKLDNKITVHMGHLAASDPQQTLPALGTFVQITNAHFEISCNINKLFLCKESKLTQDKLGNNEERKEKMFFLIQDYDIGVSDLIEIDNNIGIIEERISPLSEQSSEEIILEVLSSLASVNLKNSKIHKNMRHECLNRIIPSFTLQTISSYQCIDSCIDKKMPVWSFGVHSKIKETDILIGYLKINTRYGLMFLHDSRYCMPCIIITKIGKLDKNHINKFILIKRYYIITEIYRELLESNLECVLFDIADVIVLDVMALTKVRHVMLTESLRKNIIYNYSFKFRLLHKASISYVQKLCEAECWLEVNILSDSDSYNAYLCLNSHQIQVVPLLNQGKEYHVYHSVKLKDFKEKELCRFKYLDTSKKFNETAPLFVVACNTEHKILENVLNVTEAMTKLKSGDNDCISFQGVLKIKKFCKPLSSRTQVNINEKGYGTPGTQTHTLIFTDNLVQESELLLYINNWENLQVPLGLILNMRLCIRNVVPQKCKYFKCTAMTTFEVIDYEPTVFFDTANLSDSPEYCWKKFSFMGLGDAIPLGALIWARTMDVYIRSLRIWCVCEECNKPMTNSKTCACKNSKQLLKTSITCFVTDECGKALIISTSLDLLRFILNLEPAQFKEWCATFKYVGEYVHDSEFITTNCSKGAKAFFQKALYQSIAAVNRRGFLDVALKCRKLDTCIEDNGGIPKWFCVDAQRCE